MEWKISIEESKALMDKDIFVLENHGRKLYCRTVLSEDKTRLEMIPLSKEELKALGVTVEESYSSDVFEIDVEESEGQPEQPKKKVFNLNDPKDAEEAAQIANRQLEKLRKEKPEEWGASKPETRTETLKNKTPEELATENEDLKAKLEIVAEKEIERRMSELKMNDSEKAFFREHPEAIKGYEKGKSSQSEGASANARPDSPAQIGSARQQGYETPEEMINDLHRRARQGEAEGKIILDELMRKYVRGMRDSGNFQIKYPATPEPTESKGETITKVIGQGSSEDPTQESELERLGVKRNKGSPLRRREE